MIQAQAASPRERPFVSADIINNACYRAMQALKGLVSRELGGKGKAPVGDQGFRPSGLMG